jgi:hypothetical protein
MDSKVSSLSQTFPLNFMESDEFPSQCHYPTMSVNQEQKMLIFKVSSASGQKKIDTKNQKKRVSDTVWLR